ncbi:UvrD-helicase domain-containing protein [Vibrio cholerae]|uniref:ATP-dependent helicase n=1 Tax=Vibrio TaxID=662 RepID=UPI0028DA509B|nr:ATP-dependent helicase [Vibrio parahaemolyticus]ELJ8846287.1 ATP-dependent helicase [Vibrio parahaemolyticus]HBK7267979.1 ATP-dependent helicase [Vibrio cholerae]HCH2083439.1 ATP-dependent helicase [Vibrio parahaemolyticus]HCM0920599.1 ATP-dependent helicase [Vibrio parahaemolyticus]
MSGFQPTPQQQVAIDFDGSMVITACPGSGKTTVMTEKIRKVTPCLPDHKGVIAITFTKKASQELKQRCKHNAYDMKQSFFGTIDSFCLKELILPFVSRLWGGQPLECKVIKRLQEPYSLFLNKQYRSPTVDNILNDDGFKRLYESGFLWMNSFSALALHVLNQSIAAQRYIKAKYSHVFIDEYQDSSEAQHQLFMKLFELGLTATAVGDTSQSVYEFRGGNPDLLNSLVYDKNNFEHYEININHRCHPSIVNYASRLLNPNFQLAQCEQMYIFRRTITGNLTNAAQEITGWISDWISKNEWGITKPSDIAILAKQERSLRLLTHGLNIDYRIYSDNPLDEIGSDCSDFYSHLLAFKYGAIPNIQELIDNQFDLFITEDKNLYSIRRAVKAIREIDQVEKLVIKFHELASLVGIDDTETSDNAVREILQKQELIKQFTPLNDSEIQVMTLHKSKGLEFKVVFHFDLEEWSLPFQQVENNDWDNPIYPSLRQDINLHYVGITRAENCCILINVTQRQNRNGGFSQSNPSYFLRLPQLEGLYA